MSASNNTESLVNQGEFSSRVPPAEPLADGSWHKPGVKVGNDAAPEFSAETYPAGTAPREDTHQPNPKSEIPGQALNEQVDSSARIDPLDMPGSTSGEVHNATQFGKPMQGQTSSEHHGSGKKDSSGLASRVTGANSSSAETGDGSVESKVRGLGADLEGRAGELKGHKGASGASEGGVNWTGASELPPTSAEELASELPKGGHSGVGSNERTA